MNLPHVVAGTASFGLGTIPQLFLCRLARFRLYVGHAIRFPSFNEVAPIRTLRTGPLDLFVHLLIVAGVTIFLGLMSFIVVSSGPERNQ